MNFSETTVGLLGCGTVGGGVAKMLLEDNEFINQKLGWPLRLVKVAVRDFADPRGFDVPLEYLTTDASAVVGNPEIQVVAELMGGIEPARTLILKAIASGQHVVTANKALLAEHGREIFAAAEANQVEVMFEAAVAGGIPIIKALKEGLVANRINHIVGILNGTTNYILTRMSREGLEFGDVLVEAQSLGYAEADPTFDVEGIDAAHKLILLTALAFGSLPAMSDIYVEGISKLAVEDIELAEELGYTVKLLAFVSRDEQDGRLEVRLHPAMLPQDNLLANIDGTVNAVLVQGHAVGDVLLTGHGAGMMPTASAVLADLVELSRALRSRISQRVPALGWCRLTAETLKPMAEVRIPYYLRFTVADRPGVLASICTALGRQNISLAQVIQKGAAEGEEAVPLVMLTHAARECDLKAALAELDNADYILAPARLIRVMENLG